MIFYRDHMSEPINQTPPEAGQRSTMTDKIADICVNNLGTFLLEIFKQHHSKS